MKILFHGRLAEAIGPELTLASPPGCSVSDLRARLIAEHPEIEPHLASRRARTCVGDSLVPEDYRVGANDVVEFLPPVSGG